MDFFTTLLSTMCLLLVIATTSSHAYPNEPEQEEYHGKPCHNDKECNPIQFQTFLTCRNSQNGVGNCSCDPTEEWQAGLCRHRVSVSCKINDNRCVRNAKCDPHEFKDKYGNPVKHDEDGQCKCVYPSEEIENKLCSSALNNNVGHNYSIFGISLLSLVVKYIL